MACLAQTIMFLLLFIAVGVHGFAGMAVLPRSAQRPSQPCTGQTFGRRPSTQGIKMQTQPDSGKNDDDLLASNTKWAAPVMDEAAERIESVKAGVLSAVAGSIAMTPIGQFNTRSLSIMPALILCSQKLI